MMTPEEINDQRLRAYAEEVLAWKRRYDAERAAHDASQQTVRELRELLLSLRPLLEVKPNFQEVFISHLNGGMAVCLACGAFDDQIMIKEHRADCTSTAEWKAHQKLHDWIATARSAPEPGEASSKGEQK